MSTHLTHISLGRVWVMLYGLQVLLLLTVGILLCCCIQVHVTVVGEVGVVGAPLVLKRLDRCGEVDFTFEKFLTRDFIKFICRITVGGMHYIARIVRTYCCILCHSTYFLTAI